MSKLINNVLLSYDTVAALAMAGVVCFCLPIYVNAEFTTAFYGVGISVLSIIFSLFFAALAIVMASSDTDFISFMEEKDRRYTRLLMIFKITLIMLFISLSYSIVINAWTDYLIKDWRTAGKAQIHKGYFLIFVFLFTYSMVATGLSIKDTFIFSKYRLDFIEIVKLEKQLKAQKDAQAPTGATAANPSGS